MLLLKEEAANFISIIVLHQDYALLISDLFNRLPFDFFRIFLFNCFIMVLNYIFFNKDYHMLKFVIEFILN